MDYTRRDEILQQTILRLLNQITDSGVKVVGGGSGDSSVDTSDLAKELTLQSVDTSLNTLETIVSGGNAKSLTRFVKDGTVVSVNEDTVTPSNNTPLPVKLASATGDINITAGDLNVHLSHVGVNYDSTRIGDGTNLLAVNADGSLNVNTTISPSGLNLEATQQLVLTELTTHAVEVATNSSTTPLLANATFTGGTIDLLQYGSISYSVISDVISASNGIYIEFSTDGTNWDRRITNDYDAAHLNKVIDLVVRKHDRYARVVYINGNTNQTIFRLKTIINKNSQCADTRGIDHPPVTGDDALLTKAILTGKTTAGGGSYVDVKVNPSGTLQIDQAFDTRTHVRNINGSVTPVTYRSGSSYLLGWNIINPNSYPVYVKLYNTLTPIVGSTTPLKTLMIPPIGSVIETGEIHAFSTAISIAVTKYMADTDSTAIDTNLIIEITYTT